MMSFISVNETSTTPMKEADQLNLRLPTPGQETSAEEFSPEASKAMQTLRHIIKLGRLKKESNLIK